jgi:hypothetical protein
MDQIERAPEAWRVADQILAETGTRSYVERTASTVIGG